MKVYTCTDHDGFYPVPRASVVVAEDEAEARRLLDAALKEWGLKPHADEPYTLRELPHTPAAHVLSDGDY